MTAAGLRRFARPTPPAGEAAPDRCELCGETLPGRHSHMVDAERQSLACACTACALLFTRPGRRYRTVPDRVLHDPAAPLTAAEWAALRIPVAMAFFMASSAAGRVVASYPSAAGATECELDLQAWDRLADGHRLLRAAEPDVEAILVLSGEHSAAPSGAVEAFLVPVDVCYELAGSLRACWRGFDGGTEARELLAEFTGGIRQRSRELE
ncbi:MAG: DUF5947 family protein [Streptosporangiales bacterium]|nr:DUF5947 family protein [Streptosporangiales bacterium]